MSDQRNHDELSAGAQALIDEVRDLDGPSADDRDRVKRALVATLASGAGLAATTVASSAAAAGSTTVVGTTVVGTTAAVGGVSFVVKVAAVALVAAAIGGTALVVTQEETAAPAPPEAVTAQFAEPEPLRAPAPPRVAPSEPVEAAEVVEVSPGEPEADVAEAEPTIAEPVPTPRARRAPATRREIAVADSTLTEEIAMIRRAQRALQAGDAETALRQLDQHASRFAGGVLAEEREAARVVALCQAGRAEQSRALARRFVRERPSSPHRARVLGACPEP